MCRRQWWTTCGLPLAFGTDGAPVEWHGQGESPPRARAVPTAGHGYVPGDEVGARVCDSLDGDLTHGSCGCPDEIDGPSMSLLRVEERRCYILHALHQAATPLHFQLHFACTACTLLRTARTSHGLGVYYIMSICRVVYADDANICSIVQASPLPVFQPLLSFQPLALPLSLFTGPVLDPRSGAG